MKRVLLPILIILFAHNAMGNNLYWIQFNTKVNTPFQIEHPEHFLSVRAIERRARMNIKIDSSDLPVNPEFVDSLKQLGFSVKHTSRWMNGAIASLPSEVDSDSIFQPSFVSFYQIRKDTPLKSTTNKFSEEDSLAQKYYGDSFNQISMLNGHILHQYSKGEGTHVAIIDAGFNNADINNVFDSLRYYDGILGTFDFVSPGNNVYLEHNHGTSVLSTMAGNVPGQLIGAAPMAKYWLLRTEDSPTEFPVEEDYWIVAAEFADSVGCDVINTSLGYTTFDNPIFNHQYSELDGNTIRASIAANRAVEKGIVVVCSAGNSGNDAWFHIGVPSDAKKALSIAAVDSNRKIASFSSRGFTDSLFPPKPDVAAKGVSVTLSSTPGIITNSSGTSFSGPIIAGMAACLVSYFPEKNAEEIINLIRSSGDRFPEHNIEYGYGIPNFSSLLDTTNNFVYQKPDRNVSIYPNPFTISLTIEYPLDFNRVEIFNIQGLKVFSSTLSTSGRSEISTNKLSNLPKGVYFAVLKGNKENSPFQLIKY